MEKANKSRLILAPIQLLNFHCQAAPLILQGPVSLSDFSVLRPLNPGAAIASILLCCQILLQEKGLLTLCNNILQLDSPHPTDYFHNERMKDLWILQDLLLTRFL